MKNKFGWEKHKLGEICNLYQPKTISQQEMVIDGKYDVYGANGIIGKYDRYNHESSELLMTCRGATCGTINISNPFSWINGNAMVVKPKLANTIESKFLHYQLKAIDLKDVITGAAQPQITRQSLNGLQIIIPPLPTQHQIVSELDALSEIISKKKQQLEELDKLAQATFYDMFGDPVTNVKGWEVKKMKDLTAKINSGNTPNGGSNVYVQDGITFFRSQNVWKNNLVYEDIAFIDIQTHTSMSKSSLKHKDILMTKTGRFNTENSSLGRAALFLGEDDSANINGHVYLIRLKKNQVHAYILHILTSNSFREVIRNVCVGGIDKRQLNKNHIEEFPIIYPSIESQQKFANILESINKQKYLIKQSIAEVQALFDYTMDKYFN